MKDHAMDILKVSPPVGVSALTWFGVPLQTWVLVATFVYTVLQTYVLIRDKIIRKKVNDLQV